MEFFKMPDLDMLQQKESEPGYFASEIPEMQIVFQCILSLGKEHGRV